MEQKNDHGSLFHVELSSGGLFGDTGAEWDLSEKDLEREFLDKRAQGGEVWVQGKRFAWDDAQLRIFEGPPTERLEDFTPVLNPSAYWIDNQRLKEVTSRFVKGPPGGAAQLPKEASTGTAVFLVHGANKASREEVARFLEKVLAQETPVIVLQEEPNRGRTLIEKFEQTAVGARYAVVLLTADDVAHPVDSEETELRARQNVVFELGFFFGELGRGRVAALYDERVELPSDVQGLAYIPLDSAGGWKLALARELRDAGLDSDLNRLAE